MNTEQLGENKINNNYIQSAICVNNSSIKTMIRRMEKLFQISEKYTRDDVWSILYPNKGKRRRGGIWDTGYVKVNNFLIAFLNIDTLPRTNKKVANEYDPTTGVLKWIGKPNTHSEQPLISDILNNRLTLLMFARWDSSDPHFEFMGIGKAEHQSDIVDVGDGHTAIRMKIRLDTKIDDSEEVDDAKFGKRKSVRKHLRKRSIT